MKKFKRVLVANRGEIAIRVFRACEELGIRSVAIYSEEDKNSLFRTKADESYRIGKNKKPVDAYLGIDEIISLAKSKGVDAIHPGYGFLSENVEFARKCEEEGITFIGPDYIMMSKLGDKIKSKIVANSVGVPTIPGIEEAVKSEDDARRFADFCGYPVILKASAGGGGRGMRIVWREEDLLREFKSAQSEAKKAFGIDDIFIEKYLEKPKHIEVQVLGDNYGNLVHLYERDCSIQRRHQKVVEFTPAISITEEQRQAICSDAVKLAKAVNYRSAGTLEFLVDKEGRHYFIEMNPRIQVEHTVTEMITGIDIVQSQILIAEGYRLDSEEVNIKSQEAIEHRGYAIQCRVTTEDPANNFAPDTGKIDMYRTGSGFGIRLDGGNGFTGAEISPYYDSLLVKIISHSRTFNDAINKNARALKELKIHGVKTNTGFLLNVLNHDTFKKGQCDTGFIAENPSLLNVRGGEDKELKVLNYIGNIVVNETKGVKPQFDVPRAPKFASKDVKLGLKQLLDSKGPKEVSNWVLNEKKLLLTDTTMRDAHQSLMATRVRTVDMEKIAPAMAHMASDLFSVEMWGGATFDVAYRFLKEDPWERLKTLREKMPNILFQMLLRGANAVGYKNYPDNVIREFVKSSSKAGIDVYRIFDSLNWVEGMEVAIDEVLNQNKIVEASICYTGDILDETRDKYSLKYYVDLAKKLEKRGAHILAIKDMSALLKPMAADKLIRALKNELTIPVHLHTHDTSGNGVVTVYAAANAGVDIVDTAFNSMAGLTSQPPLNSVIAALNNTERDTMLNSDDMQKISDYWEAVRPVYSKFESGLKTGTAEIYKYEIPGGQYSNLKPQVESFGLGHRFEEVKEMFKTVNEMLGDIVKVTPSSKAVGDMAIFMVQNDLNAENIYEKAKDMDFPDSIVSYFEGMMGQPEGGFPEKLSKLVLKGKEPIKCRPGELLPAEDFDTIKKMLQEKHGLEGTDEEALSYALYPKVFEDYLKNVAEEGNLRLMGSDIFFHGLEEGETCGVKIAEGKKLSIKLVEVKANDDGTKDLVFEVNGNRRVVTIKDRNAINLKSASVEKVMADTGNQYEIGANIPGNVYKIVVKQGDKVEAGQPIAVLEAMKMETNVIAPLAGTVAKIYVKENQRVVAGELIAELE
ncbi:MAG: pyruvate carboxylase [Sedimentibacter sp.]|uniref:pyruvate carboxylase n=1 Tax=Sedimentibacter sp. TaxID=1960295 RepID=UPI0029825928|nr:pyruvate carboxylase [Sedimentibacter sp.]MDW5299223.1 pyruvate carboxylase [Sedimentibacter sp.]